MFHHFFVPLDGSERAEKAIPVAARLAHEASGTVTLVRVIMPSGNSEEYGANMLASELRQVQPRVRAESKAYLDDVLERYNQELDGLHIVLETVPGTGPIPSILLDHSSQEHSDVIVMCSRGSNWLKRWIFGSVAQATFRRSPLPVLVLSDQGQTLTLDYRPLRVLVPLDGSEISEAILEPVFQLLLLVPAPAPHEVHLLQVVPTPAMASFPPATGWIGNETAFPDLEYEEKELQEARHVLQNVAKRLSQTNPVAARCSITTSAKPALDVAGAILKQAAPVIHGEADQHARGYDLIALATHGRSGLKRAVLGSVTEHVFGATPLPLFVVSPSTAHTKEKHILSEKAGETEQRWVGLF